MDYHIKNKPKEVSEWVDEIQMKKPDEANEDKASENVETKEFKRIITKINPFEKNNIESEAATLYYY